MSKYEELEKLLKESVYHELNIFINSYNDFVVKGKTWLMCGKPKVGMGKTLEEAFKNYNEDEYWHCCEDDSGCIKESKKKDIFQKIEEVLKEHFDNLLYRNHIKLIKETLNFRIDLDFDDMDEVDFIIAVENKFNIEIRDEDAVKIKTISDAVEIILGYS